IFKELDKKQLHIRDQIRLEYNRIKEKLGRRPSRMELFTYMEDDIYQLAIAHAKDNPFRNYLDFLREQSDLTEDEQTLCSGVGKEFIHLLETTSMSKVYKMPVLMAFYNHGDIRMAVTEEELLASWKEFFSNGTNWKDLDKDITYESYKKISDREHLKKILQMPVHFLLQSGKGFFVNRDGYALVLADDLEEAVKLPAFSEQMGDVIAYRTMDYYRRRYQGKCVI
ncbi:MAG: NgoFVII family restriction endonuclease, partial [Coprococcus sp.]